MDRAEVIQKVREALVKYESSLAEINHKVCRPYILCISASASMLVEYIH